MLCSALTAKAAKEKKIDRMLFLRIFSNKFSNLFKGKLNEHILKIQFDYDEKSHLCEQLKVQLDGLLKQNDNALLERSETIQRLNKKLNDLQKHNDELMIKQPSSTLTDAKLVEKIGILNQKNSELEEHVKLLEAIQQNTCDSSDLNASELKFSHRYFFFLLTVKTV